MKTLIKILFLFLITIACKPSSPWKNKKVFENTTKLSFPDKVVIIENQEEKYAISMVLQLTPEESEEFISENNLIKSDRHKPYTGNLFLKANMLDINQVLFYSRGSINGKNWAIALSEKSNKLWCFIVEPSKF